jgi:integral membrane sensor domain MASE1
MDSFSQTSFGLESNTGLSFALILVLGRRMLPLLFVAPFLADLVNRQVVLPWTVEISSVALIGGVYSLALVFLERPSIRFDPALSSIRDLMLLMLVVMVSAGVVASGYVGLTIAAGLLSAGDFVAAALRYWIGDVVGILALAPLALFALMHRRILPTSTETAIQCIAIVAALVLVFGLAEEREFQLFYMLFLPIIWMSVRNGTESVSLDILITQVGVIFGVSLFHNEGKELGARRRTARAAAWPIASTRRRRRFRGGGGRSRNEETPGAVSETGHCKQDGTDKPGCVGPLRRSNGGSSRPE